MDAKVTTEKYLDSLPNHLGIKVQLSLRAFKLNNVSSFFKISNPYAVVNKFKPQKPENIHILTRTEAIKNDLSPKWSSAIILDWNFGEDFFVRADVYGEMKKSEGRFMGYCEFEIGNILRSKGGIEIKKSAERERQNMGSCRKI